MLQTPERIKAFAFIFAYAAKMFGAVRPVALLVMTDFHDAGYLVLCNLDHVGRNPLCGIPVHRVFALRQC